ncbi:MAG: hypothetical protein ACRC80_31635 [Waterburya sp.]
MNEPEHTHNQESKNDKSFSTFLSFLSAKLNKLKDIYEQQEIQLPRNQDFDSIPPHYRYLETQASRFEFDELLKPISTSLADTKGVNKSKKNADKKVFQTSVTHFLNLRGLGKKKVMQQAARLRWIHSLRLELSKLLIILFLVPIFLGIGMEVKSSSQDINSPTSTSMIEYAHNGLQGLGKGVFVNFCILYLLLILPEEIFSDFTIYIKEAERIKLPELKRMLLKLQALGVDPYVEFDLTEEQLRISLFLDLGRIEIDH